MSSIHNIINWLYLIVFLGCTCRAISILLIMMTAENKAEHKKKLWNVFVFLIVGESISGIVNLIVSYIGVL